MRPRHSIGEAENESDHRMRAHKTFIMFKADDGHVVGRLDSIDVPVRISGRTFYAPKMAANIPGAVGMPASAFNSHGLQVWTQREVLIGADGKIKKEVA